MSLDLLGGQLLLACRFQDSGFDPNLELHCEVTGKTEKAGEIFSKVGERWFMREASLPGLLAVKAVAIDGEDLLLETSPINLEKVRQTIIDNMMPFGCDPAENGFVFVDATTERELISVGPTEKPEGELGARCLWTIPIVELDKRRKLAVVEMADAVYTAEAYDVEEMQIEAGAAISVAVINRMQLRLQMEFQQRLQMEQRPILSVTQEIAPEILPQQRLELQQIMAINRRLLTMKPEELPKFFDDYIQKHGEAAAIDIAVFALAGKVKQAAPGLSWRDARKKARDLMRRRSA